MLQFSLRIFGGLLGALLVHTLVSQLLVGPIVGSYAFFGLAPFLFLGYVLGTAIGAVSVIPFLNWCARIVIRIWPSK